MNDGLKIQRCNFLPEGEMAIVKDTNTLIHNIIDSELKEKDKEIERLKSQINLLDDNRIYLNDKIDKAIEYINTLREDYFNRCVVNSNKDLGKIIDILQGSDKNE